MNDDVKYLLDANIFIQAHQTYYAFDIAPSFWNELIHNAEQDKLVSIDQIKEELHSGKDDDPLSVWATNEFKDWFKSCTDEKVYKCYSEIMEWAQNHDRFKEAAKEEFAGVADSWILAYAKAYEYTIVTHETYDPNIKNRIKIPNVCEAFGISYTNTFNMLRDLNIKIG